MSRPSMLPVCLGACLYGFGLSGLSGCAKEQELLDVKTAPMQDTVQQVQRSRDREFEGFEREMTTTPGTTPAPPVSGAGGKGPPKAPPKAVRINGEADETDGADDIDDPSPRPILKAIGAPGVSRSSRGRLRSAEVYDDDDRTTTSTHDPNRPSALDPEARRAYDAAMSQVTAKRYGEALESLAGFLVKWPDHPYGSNALYWRGECFLAQGDTQAALREFEGTVSRFPLGNKAPDALLKLGIVYEKAGELEKSQAAYTRLAREFPRSDAAKRAPRGTTSAPAKATKGPKENP